LGSIYKYLRDFYEKEFNWLYAVMVLLLLGTLIYFNYWHALEKRFAAGGKSKLAQFTGYYFLYLAPFGFAFLIQPFFFKDCSYFKSGWFWFILLIAPALFSFRINFDYHEGIIARTWAGNEWQFRLRSINWVVRVFVLLIPVFITWWIKDRGNQPFYGTAALQNIKPYLFMLLIMLPLIVLASTQDDFLHTYPKAKFLIAMDPPMPWWKILIYELCYGFDFISIEFFFRGFLILSLLSICGMHCIIPVACFYCAIHLGKPMGEAISSIFGGLLLGIVSYHTKSIWGGLIVHLGIAWMMEAGGWIGGLIKGK